MAEKKRSVSKGRTKGSGFAAERGRPVKGKKGGLAPMSGKDGGQAPSAPSTMAADGGLVDMDEAIAMLKTTRPTFYRWLRSGKIRGAKAGRQWRFRRDDIQRFLAGDEPRIELRADIGPLTEMLRGRVRDLTGQDPGVADVDAPRWAVILMLQLAAVMRAVDIQFAPTVSPQGSIVVPLRYRIDGTLHHVADIDVRLLPAIVDQCKAMAGCDIHEKSRPQEGRIIARTGDGRDVDVRVCFVPTGIGDAVTARLTAWDQAMPSMDSMPLSKGVKATLLAQLASRSGLIIASGPAGSGKTTLLYACTKHVAGPAVNVMSLEDPVEFRLPGVVQIEINEAAGFTFGAGLRAVTRSSPDVIMIGEIRDLETVRAAVQLATTGHLVLTQLHAEDTGTSIQRLLDAGVEPFRIAEGVRLIVAQRLVRLLCPKCAGEYSPPVDLCQQAEELARKGGLDWDALPKRFRRPVGCPVCGGIGFHRRTVISEAFGMTPEIARSLRQGASGHDAQAMAVAQGMVTLAADGVRCAAEGTTTIEEVFGVLGSLVRG